MRESMMNNKSAALSFLETSNIKHVLNSVFKRLALHNLHTLPEGEMSCKHGTDSS